VETEDGQSLLLRRLNTLLSRVGDFWLRRSYFQQIALVIVLLLAKNAFDIELRNIQEAYLPGAQEFPQAVGYYSASFGQVIMAYGLGVTTTTQWVVLHAVLIAIALGVAFYLISKAGPERRSFIILVLASATATSSLFVSIGKYDVITYLGAVLLALARTLPGAAVGALIMVSGNPEQAVVASLALVFLSLAPAFSDLRLRGLVAGAIAGTAWFGVQTWFRFSEMETGRAELLLEYLGQSLSQVIVSPGTSLWSWLNAGWLLVVFMTLSAPRSSMKWIIAGLVVIPGLATIVTADGARVFGLIVLPAYVIAALRFARAFRPDSRPYRILIGSSLIALVVLPTIVEGQGWLVGQVMGLHIWP